MVGTGNDNSFCPFALRKTFFFSSLSNPGCFEKWKVLARLFGFPLLNKQEAFKNICGCKTIFTPNNFCFKPFYGVFVSLILFS